MTGPTRYLSGDQDRVARCLAFEVADCNRNLLRDLFAAAALRPRTPERFVRWFAWALAKDIAHELGDGDAQRFADFLEGRRRDVVAGEVAVQEGRRQRTLADLHGPGTARQGGG